ncbi:ester cyclase [Hymenobacter terrenus]|uniref:ester cyclase n=1 Tax=Hymenobacter terrenus TaxID=1629124 RepID=UPI0006971D7C|nr:nuclear transport factor 2 family protein [Hymenobacter terrenus]
MKATPKEEKKARKKAKQQQAKADKKRNLEVVLRYMNEGIGKVDLTAFDACLHPDVQIFTGLKPQGPIEGVEEYKQVFAGFAEAFPVRQFTIDEVFATKNKVVVRFTAVVAFKRDYYGVVATNEVIEMKEVHVLTLQEGRVVSNIVSGTNFPFEYLMYPVLKDAVIGHLPLDVEV